MATRYRAEFRQRAVELAHQWLRSLGHEVASDRNPGFERVRLPTSRGYAPGLSLTLLAELLVTEITKALPRTR